jgi:hypothetical protein
MKFNTETADQVCRLNQKQISIMEKTREEKLQDFLEEIDAHTIRETSWPIHNGKTEIKFMIANSKQFFLMLMREHNKLTSMSFYVQANDSGLITDTFDAVRKFINPELGNPKVASFHWCTDDIIERAKEYDGREVSEADAIEILAIIKDKHDCNIGVNWEVLDAHTDMYFHNKESAASSAG